MECKQIDVFYYIEQKEDASTPDSVFLISVIVLWSIICAFLALESYLRFFVSGPTADEPITHEEEIRNFLINSEDSKTAEELKLEKQTQQNTLFNQNIGRLKFRSSKRVPIIDSLLDEKNNNISAFQTKYSFPRSNDIMRNPNIALLRLKSSSIRERPLLCSSLSVKTTENSELWRPAAPLWICRKNSSPTENENLTTLEGTVGDSLKLTPTLKKHVRFTMELDFQQGL